MNLSVCIIRESEHCSSFDSAVPEKKKKAEISVDFLSVKRLHPCVRKLLSLAETTQLFAGFFETDC